MTTPSDTAPGFDSFALDPRLLTALGAVGFENPTPIQANAIGPLLEGRDVMGRARTGSGKTAAFGLPLLHRIREGGRHVRALVLTPTRELAIQVSAALRSLVGKLPVKILPIYGGTPYGPQLKALSRGVQAVVGTPGRVKDLIERRALDLSHVDVFVVDEADEMLRMGFIEDVERILSAAPDTRQIALFSATMPPRIERIANAFLNDPMEIQVESRGLSTGHIQQQWMLVPDRHKIDALVRVLKAVSRGAALIFARTRVSCAEAADLLIKRGIAADALHGDLSQPARERVLNRLRAGRLDVVIATDVAARGIDVEHLDLVINLDMPGDHESYVHRIGRTGRAGRAGLAISFVTHGQRRRVKILEQRLKVRIEQVPVPSDAAIARRRRADLDETLVQALSRDDIEQARPWLEKILERGEHDLETIALAALGAMARADKVDLAPIPEEAPPSWAQPMRSREGRTDDRGLVNEVSLHIPVGSNGGVRPVDIVGALTNTYKIPGRELGRITILHKRAFVGTSARIAKHIIDSTEQLVIRGRDVRISLAQERAPGPPSDDKPRPVKSHKGKPPRRDKPGKGPKPSGKPLKKNKAKVRKTAKKTRK